MLVTSDIAKSKGFFLSPTARGDCEREDAATDRSA